jgi:hypothetical protein
MTTNTPATIEVEGSELTRTIARLEMEGGRLVAVERSTRSHGRYKVTYLGMPPCPTRRPRHHHVARVFAGVMVALALAGAPRSAGAVDTLAVSLDAPTGQDGALALESAGDTPATRKPVPGDSPRWG